MATGCPGFLCAPVQARRCPVLPGCEARPLPGHRGHLTPLVCGSCPRSPCFAANQQSKGHRGSGRGSPDRPGSERAGVALCPSRRSSPPVSGLLPGTVPTVSPANRSPIHRQTVSQEKKLMQNTRFTKIRSKRPVNTQRSSKAHTPLLTHDDSSETAASGRRAQGRQPCDRGSPVHREGTDGHRRLPESLLAGRIGNNLTVW